ncbi:calcium-binding protein [Nostoc linckia]|uniref:calcium-binding protein n=1 Tax=Nostoc linckia TaxID=92942 RepID=UPI000BFF932C|nr:calcium-binding protein [Nostoc linckia]
MPNIIGTNGNDTLLGSNSADTINGKAGNDTITAKKGNDTLTGGGGKDKFVYNLGDGIDTIADFGGVGKGTNPTAGVIAEVDTIKFQGSGLTAQKLVLTQNGTDLEITFVGVAGTKVILKNFKLEDLENSKASGGKPAIGNIIFDGQSSIIDSFNVLDANSTQTSVGTANIVTFLNDLDNNITGLDNSSDVVNGQGGNDKIDGKSGDDLLRGGTGNDTLIGGAGNDILVGGIGNDSLIGGTGNDLLQGDVGNDTLVGGLGNDTINGGAGDDYLIFDESEGPDFSGNSLLSGGDGNDYFSLYVFFEGFPFGSSGNNTLNGGAGNDGLDVEYSQGNNLLDGGIGNDNLSVGRSSGDNVLNGGDGNDKLSSDLSTGNNLLNGGSGNDSLSSSGVENDNDLPDIVFFTSGQNTLEGGAGDDYLNVDLSTGNNLLNGGSGNDSLFASGIENDYYFPDIFYVTSGQNTLDGGTGNDYLNISYSSGDNLLNGGDGNDTLTASLATGKNTLKGGNGNDYLIGGEGNDSLYGEGGDDTFAFNSFNEGIDTIYDFDTNNDVIRVSAVGFGGGLSPDLFSGILPSGRFTIGASATTSSQRFIYNSTTGALFFDRDGNAGGFTQVQFAQLSTDLSLTNFNFQVV